ncbi:zinc-dependent alcohol dehydrogenase family protein [Pseudonocardia bannensis]|uniref:Zinc-dependent alcohol dehydrogenase family protein n=1 Tax=Pseudonocardia bannensis TaxID=630973 RepID=A0A848DEL2_9PSEU|nr:zinc-dependent alcohol dehydrogenase family protein [Pseudonocardia bannensis]NMH91027.1 zinc-dependent alcohol dehydrogenase family protein [Pseudonocardia bannensis]
MVRTIRFHELGGPEVLRYEDLPVRSPGPGEVRMRVDAFGLNRAEVNFRRGTYLEDPVLPAGLGYEASGEILEVGPDVARWAVGDAVSVVPAFSQNDYPIYAEEAVVPAAALVGRPDGMDAVTGAAIWMPYVTVYGALQEVTRVRPGDHVVITAATNSVGMAAIQVVRHLGAIPIATTRTAEKHPALLEAGAATVIATDSEDLTEAIRAATGGRGAEFAFDAVGGPQVEQLARAMAPDGRIIVHGNLSGQPTPLPGNRFGPVWMRRYTLFEITKDPAGLRRAEHFVRAGLEAGAFVPVIDRIFGFDDIVAAHIYVDSDERRLGKPVVQVRPARSGA